MKNMLSLSLILILSLFIFRQNVSALTLVPQSLTVNGNSVQLQVPQNMRVEFVAAMDRPRFLALGSQNELIIGSRSGIIYRVNPPYQLAEELVSFGGFPHSTAYRDGILYVAETAAIWSAPYTNSSTILNRADFSIVAALPSATGGHSSRTILTGPDNRLYIGLGISGNCSDEYLHGSYSFETRRGGVFVLNGDNLLAPFSSGLRNPIGLAFHPVTGSLYATNAGPDNLGYDNPPEIFSRLSDGSFHGMPWYQYFNGSFQSGECAQSLSPRPASEAVVPSVLFDPRSTPQGIAFVNEVMEQAAGGAVVAIHGSWATIPGQGVESRRPPKLVLVEFQNNEPVGTGDMVTGFQRSDGSRFARPSGVAVGNDGNIYFTSDGGEVTGLFRLVPQAGGGTQISVLTLILGILGANSVPSQ